MIDDFVVFYSLKKKNSSFAKTYLTLMAIYYKIYKIESYYCVWNVGK